MQGGKGIWGTWEISSRSLGYVSDRGGFHIWPKGMADPTGEELRAEERVPGEVEEVVLVGEVASGGVVDGLLTVIAFVHTCR